MKLTRVETINSIEGVQPVIFLTPKGKNLVVCKQPSEEVKNVLKNEIGLVRKTKTQIFIDFVYFQTTIRHRLISKNISLKILTEL